jgi:hypothetical protein
MGIKTTLADRRAMTKDNAKWPLHLKQVPRDQWPSVRPGLIEVWRSRGFLVQFYIEKNGYVRMSVNRTTHNGNDWVAAILWDELMRLKRECGRGESDALELYPADNDVVNVANIRHLFFPPGPVAFKWMGDE